MFLFHIGVLLLLDSGGSRGEGVCVNASKPLVPTPTVLFVCDYEALGNAVS